MRSGVRVRQRLPVRLVVDNRRNDVRHRLARKRLLARQHLVEHAAECPDVGSLVHGFATRLLG